MTVKKAFVPSAKTAVYSVFPNDAAKSAFTLAALIVTGFAKPTKTSVAKGGKGNLDLLRAIISAPVLRYHKERVREGGLTKEGVAWMKARVEGSASAYRTDLPVVLEIVDVLKKGGVVEFGETEVNFNREVAV